jgi:hypothetical protein
MEFLKVHWGLYNWILSRSEPTLTRFYVDKQFEVECYGGEEGVSLTHDYFEGHIISIFSNKTFKITLICIIREATLTKTKQFLIYNTYLIRRGIVK